MKNQFAHTLFNSTGGYAALALRLPVGLILAACVFRPIVTAHSV